MPVVFFAVRSREATTLEAEMVPFQRLLSENWECYFLFMSTSEEQESGPASKNRAASTYLASHSKETAGQE